MSDNLSALFACLERLCAACFGREPRQGINPAALLRESNGILTVIRDLLVTGEDEIARRVLGEYEEVCERIGGALAREKITVKEN